MGTDGTNQEQKKRMEQKKRLEKLRADGRTYREIAKIEQLSIAQISRILNSNKSSNGTDRSEGERAAEVFRLLEEGETLAEIVIHLKLPPKAVEHYHGEWVRLKEVDTNLPNLENLDQKLDSHISDHHENNLLLQEAIDAGDFRKERCGYADQNGVCMLHSPPEEEEIQASPFQCALCSDFVLGEEGMVYIPLNTERRSNQYSAFESLSPS